MGTVVLVLTIGIVNLCLGYMTAVRLGLGPPSLLDAWAALSAGRNPAHGLREQNQPDAGPAVAGDAFRPPPGGSHGLLGEQTTLGSTNPPPEVALSAEELDDMFGAQLAQAAAGSDPATGDKQTLPKTHDAAKADPGDSDVEALEQLDDTSVEIAVLKLNLAIIHSTTSAVEIERRLRAVRGQTDEETIRQAIEQLKENCRTYLAEHEEAAERFGQRIGDLGEIHHLGEQIERTNWQQVAQIETTLSNLEHMDFQSDLEAANARLLDELARMRKSHHRLHDDQEQAFLAIAEHRGRMGRINPKLGIDLPTGLPNRIGLQITLSEWWSRQEHRKRPMAAALFDFDHFGAINEEHGSWIADALLQHLARHLKNQARPSDLLARFSGQRLAMMTLDLGPRAATRQAELLRQTAERTTFSLNGRTFVTTLSAAVTEVATDDSPQTVFARLEAAMKEAKQAGGNRCCFHTGRTIELVESPSLGAPHTEIDLSQYA